MMSHPSICCFDLESATITKLSAAFEHVYQGSMGKQVRIYPRPFDYVQLLDHWDKPANYHEYNVFLIDHAIPETIEYKFADHHHEHIKSPGHEYYFVARNPVKIFDPRPFNIRMLAEMLVNRPALIILFGGKKEQIEYEFSDGEKMTVSNYELTGFDEITKNKTGNLLTVNPGASMAAFLKKYLPVMRYEVIFNFAPAENQYASYPIDQVEPLAFNRDGEVVSFFSNQDRRKLFVFPRLDNYHQFLPAFLQQIAPLYAPEFFPEYDGKKWLQDKLYYPPGHATLLAEKQQLTTQYQADMIHVEKQIALNTTRYQFLQDILTATGEELVKSVKQLLDCFGFDHVELADEKKTNVFEEDLEITDGDKTLLIEIKGIYGTSKDSDCSQIYKVVNRRREEKHNFKIFGLYLVNHQRGVAPLDRNNPPFTPHQVTDATHDKRGLLTTWRLYNLYLDWQAGLITTDQLKPQFYKHGLVDFDYPDLIEVGIVSEIHHHGKVIILMPKIEIRTGMQLYFYDGLRHHSTDILTIQLDGKTVDLAFGAEAGVKLSAAVKEGMSLFLYQPAASSPDAS